jgi:adenine phosphoribosyltransferase
VTGEARRERDRVSWAEVGEWGTSGRDAGVLRELGPALGDLYDVTPSVVLGPVSRGSLVGALTAAALGVGFVEMRKGDGPASDSDRWVRCSTGPNYQDRDIVFGFRRELVRAGTGC